MGFIGLDINVNVMSVLVIFVEILWHFFNFIHMLNRFSFECLIFIYYCYT
jgi:hypothetical protein